MAGQQWVALINPASPQSSGAGTALSTATTATLSPVTGSAADVAQVNAEGQYLGWAPGGLYRVTARGFITTTATSTTFTPLLAARVGNSGSTYVTLATAAAVTTPASVQTGIQWKLEAVIRCLSCATSGSTLATQGEMIFGALAAQTILTATAGVNVALPNASGETQAAVDTTQVQGISMRGTLAGANATVQLTQWLVESLST
jgi:hypothetical protein